jgi:DNA-3-methyladenine glycosylase II
MARLLIEVPEIHDGLTELVREYPHVKELCPDPLQTIKRSKYDDAFRGLLRIVVGQQVSTKAADSIWKKMVDAFGEEMNERTILQQDYDVLRSCGLSGRKVEYVQGAAKAVQDGSLNLKDAAELSDTEIAQQIIALKGFGQWSVDMFLLFGLGRGNVWADGDLGVKMGLQIFLDQDERPDDAQMKKYREVFAPHGSAASLLMWHIKHHEK